MILKRDEKMVMKHKTVPYLSSVLIVLLPMMFLISVFVGESIAWAEYPHDNWRIEQLMLIGTSIAIYAFGIYPYQKPKIVSVRVFIGCLIWVALVTVSIFSSISVILALLDICLTLSIFLYLYVLCQALKQLTNVLNLKKYDNQSDLVLSNNMVGNLMAVMALSPVYVSFWCVLGHYLYITSDVTLAWHGAFVNIRYYDDTLLPCLFLLWTRPGFLQSRPFVVLICSSCYLLTLWLDAARAVWLGIFIGIIFSFFYHKQPVKKKLQQILLPIVSIVFSVAMYLLLLSLLPKMTDYTVLRATTSGRLDMWMNSVYLWSSNWLLGIGGANFIFYDEVNHLKLGHIHNIVLHFMLEWGLAGLILVLTITYLYFRYIILSKGKIPLLLFVGVIGLSINMLLSGAHIYPQSQVAMLVYFAYVITFLQKKSSNANVMKKHLYTCNTNKHRTDLYFVMLLVLSIILIGFACMQYKGFDVLDIYFGPRFWQNGNALFRVDGAIL